MVENEQMLPGGEAFNLTWLDGRGTIADIRGEMAKIGVGDYAAAYMAAKAEFFVFRAENLRAPAANILKQEFLSKGGEVAVHPRVIVGDIERSAVIMMATRAQYRRICAGLKRQQFGLPLLAEELEQALCNIRRAEWRMALPGGREMVLTDRPAIMGILNVTPDSFSDGGQHEGVPAALQAAEQMLADGALMIDVGGESTRPGHQQITEDEEIARVVPVIQALRRRTDAPISIDTYKPRVARAALAAGADIINDIWGLQYPGDAGHEMAALAAEYGCPVIAMHNQQGTVYGERPIGSGIPGDLMSDVAYFFRRCRVIAREAGMSDDQLIFDIGFGFGKDHAQNMEVLARVSALRILGRPLLVAASRKSTLGELTGRPVDQRVVATAATTAAAALSGAALVRVHDVAETRDILRVCAAMGAK